MGTLLELNPPSNKNTKQRDFSFRVIFHTVVILLLALTMVSPFVFMLSASLKPTALAFYDPIRTLIPQHIYWNNYHKVFTSLYYFHWIANSLKVVIISILFFIFVVTMAAYAFARLRFRGRNVLFLFVISTMAIPTDTTIVSKYLLYKYLHLLDTHWAIIIPAIFDVFFIFLLRQFFMSIPHEITEAAIIDGCSHYRVYLRIILPLAVPALITMMVFSFVYIWNDYANPFIFITTMKKQLVTVGLQFFQQKASADYALQMAGATIVVLIPIILFSFFQRFFVEGITSSGVKG